MCVVKIPDDVMLEAGLRDETDATIEVACRLYDGKRISLLAAMRMSGLDRTQFWDELLKRGMPWMRVDDHQWQEDKESLRHLGWTA